MQRIPEVTDAAGPKSRPRTIRDQLVGMLNTPAALLSAAARETTQRQLDGPPLPMELAHVAIWWHELAETRQSTGFGLGRLTYPDVLAWAALTMRAPTPVEVEALLAGDRAFIGEVSASADAPSTYDPDVALAEVAALDAGPERREEEHGAT